MNGIVKGLDPKTVSGRHKHLVALVPENERELTSQVFKAVGAEVFVQMQRYLAVGFRSKFVPALFQFVALAFKIIELAVDDDPYAVVFIRNGLIAGREIDNA